MQIIKNRLLSISLTRLSKYDTDQDGNCFAQHMDSESER